MVGCLSKTVYFFRSLISLSSSEDRYVKCANEGTHTHTMYYVMCNVQSTAMGIVSVGTRGRVILPGCWKEFWKYLALKSEVH